MNLLKNLRVMSSVAASHLADDPVHLGFQIARRVPGKISHPVARLLAQRCTSESSLIGNMSLSILGEDKLVSAHLEQSAGQDLSVRRRLQLADIAVVTKNIGTAERLLSSSPDSARKAISEARLLWFNGRFSEAVERLSDYGGEASRLRERYLSEYRTFRGQGPVMHRFADYRPVSNRVLHVLTNSLPHTGSGYAQRSHSILVSLKNQGWEVAAVTRLGYPLDVGLPNAKPQDVIDGITYYRLIPNSLQTGMDHRLQQFVDELSALVREFRPAVLHTTTHFVNALVVRTVAEAFGIPWVYEVRGQLADTWASADPEHRATSERYRLFVEREAEAARSANAVVTLGKSMQENLMRQDVDPSKIFICPNAVGESFLETPGTMESARTALGLDPSLDYLGTVSSIVPYEGLDVLVDAFARLTPDFPRARLLIVGDGVSLPALKTQVRDLGLEEKVVFTGRVARDLTPTYHQALCLFVVPRKDLDVTRSVTPLKPVEASASSRAIVASDLPALRELVQDGFNGILSEPDSPEALAEAIARGLSDPKLREELGARGREWVLEDRTWSANARKYSAMYESLGAELR
ncbi:glycosyltransferase family 4 protein [Neomicrococcus aestuarii]|uniref:Uncharacterized protein n=1 Tax=Neomicrococcus aestuarii TaxID=556325 RepID=A0A1L2ZL53_9MICC|nr:glycosyltransferase family 4 protein [Neomicrococcus aestuarii]APF39939.1 hypothetical protein BHE16_01665 [Neomicrococcus aestuarii]